MKICSKCQTPKDDGEFYSSKQSSDGLHPWCKDCRKTGDKTHYANNREWILIREWVSSLRRRYNMTLEDYQNLLDKQNGVCAVCLQPERTQRQLCVDHDHICCAGENSCGKCVRGLLCSKCNRGLGLLKDSIEIVKRALQYLEDKRGEEIKPSSEHCQVECATSAS